MILINENKALGLTAIKGATGRRLIPLFATHPSAHAIQRYLMLRSVLLLLAVLANPALAAPAPAAPDVHLLNATTAAASSEAEREELRAVYTGTGSQNLWAAQAQRLALLKALAGLEADGISLEKIGVLPGSRAAQIEDDVLATRAFLRAVHAMAGDTTDRTLIPGWHIARPQRDLLPAVIAAVKENKAASLLHDLRPRALAYSGLRAAHVSYLRLAAERWEPVAADGARIVERDDPRMADVARILTLLGDLDEGRTDDEALAGAIRRFQGRHGLDMDGRVGPATLAQLNVPPKARAAQIAANLEYWRLLPASWPARYVVVNTAAAHLDVMSNGKSSFATRVIVGDPNHPTPITAASITGVTFNPPWTVPYSIATKEILPRLRRDPTYLERHNIEIVDRPEDPYGRQLDWARYSRAHFPFQLRQVPGPGNALGLVKFEMPNEFNVYLHDTNNRSLFAKNERALSHGCVRVQCARELAEHLIDDPSVWIATDLLSALEEGRTHRVPLKQQLPVFLLYFTAFVDDAGVLNFRPDIYGRDLAVQRALNAQYSPATSSVSPSRGR